MPRRGNQAQLESRRCAGIREELTDCFEGIWKTATIDRLWPVRDPRRADLNVRNRGVAAIGSSELNASKGR